MTIKINPHSVIAFDLDDTLYKEVNFVRSAFIEIAMDIQPEAWESLYLQMFQQFREQQDVFGFLEATYGRIKGDLLTKYREHIPSIGITKNPIELITMIQGKGGKAGVITDGREITQSNKLRALGLFDQMDFIVISEQTGYDKHTSHNFKMVEAKYPGHQFTYIADNPKKDFFQPNCLGWNTIGILDHGAHIHSQTVPHSNKLYLPKNWIPDLNYIQIH